MMSRKGFGRNLLWSYGGTISEFGCRTEENHEIPQDSR
jgi:hypothetical protein